MVGRVFLVLLGGIIVSAGLTLFLASRERAELVAHVRMLRAAERVEQLVLMLDTVPAEARASVIAAVRHPGFAAQLVAGDSDQGEQDDELTALLRERLGEARRVSVRRMQGAACSGLPRSAELRSPRASCTAVLVGLQDGSTLRLLQAPQRDPVPGPMRGGWPWPWFFFLACLGLLAYTVARMSTRPLEDLARAATELGADIERPPLAERGPSEVRRAASAFNAMQQQIRRHVQERTHMLAAITHDLQTPLTRLRLRLEKVEDLELRERLLEDLSATRGMIRDGLDLAQSMSSEEPRQPIDFDSILDAVCADAADAGQDVTWSGRTHVSINAQPNGIQRCLANLVDNALKYGGFARVTASREDGKVVVRVRDGGPGIPDSLLEKVFEPFFRLERSRSRETGGTGIGLTISRNIAEKQGGALSLSNAPEGGLVATLELPIA
jgi:signal transduction histidine kinase